MTPASRFPFRAVVFWFVWLSLFAWFASYGATTPENRFPLPIASTLLQAHPGLVGIFVGVGLLGLVTASGNDGLSRRLGPIVGIILLLPLVAFYSPWPSPLQGLLILVAVAVLVALVVLHVARDRWRTHGWSPTVVAWSAAALGEAAAAFDTVRQLKFSPLCGNVFGLVSMAALVSLTEPSTERQRGVLLVAVLAMSASVYRNLLPSLNDASTVVHTISILIVAYYGLRGVRGRWPSGLAAWSCVMTLLLFVQAALLQSFLVLPSLDIHLRDTTFEVGVTHLEGLAIVLAILTLWLREREPRRGTRLIAYAGLGLVAVGSEVFCGSQLLLGIRGMPRRCVEYLPLFETLHVVVASAATVLLVGLVVAVSVVKRVRRESATAAVAVFD